LLRPTILSVEGKGKEGRKGRRARPSAYRPRSRKKLISGKEKKVFFSTERKEEGEGRRLTLSSEHHAEKKKKEVCRKEGEGGRGKKAQDFSSFSEEWKCCGRNLAYEEKKGGRSISYSIMRGGETIASIVVILRR